CLVVAYYRLGLLHHVPSTDFPYTTLFRSQFLINDRDDEGLYIDLDLPENMPSAFVCNCDQVARNLIQKLNDMGYRVPDDCSVASFDNDIYATITEPQLTTVEVNVEEMAGNAVNFIVEKIKGSKVNYGRVSVKGNIIYRDSVKAINQ